MAKIQNVLNRKPKFVNEVNNTKEIKGVCIKYLYMYEQGTRKRYLTKENLYGHK